MTCLLCQAHMNDKEHQQCADGVDRYTDANAKLLNRGWNKIFNRLSGDEILLLVHHAYEAGYATRHVDFFTHAQEWAKQMNLSPDKVNEFLNKQKH